MQWKWASRSCWPIVIAMRGASDATSSGARSSTIGETRGARSTSTMRTETCSIRAQDPGYHVLDRKGLYQWGPDLPDDFIDARLTPRRLWTILKLAANDRPRLKKMLALKSGLANPGRPWQR